MRIGVISDIHGNALALEKCLKTMEYLNVDEIYCLGDYIGYLPEARLILETMRLNSKLLLIGNHEAILLGRIPLDQNKEKIYRLNELNNELSPLHLSLISNLPILSYKQIEGCRILFTHASPWEPYSQYIYPNSDLSRFRELSVDVVFMGHTHIPFISRLGDLLVVNVGSCGLPRDQGNLASFALYDTDNRSCEIIRVIIDVNKIIRKYDCLHQTVINCLLRKSLTQPFGTLLD